MKSKGLSLNIVLIALLIGCHKETLPPEATAPAEESKSASQPVAPASAPYDLQFLDTMSKHHTSAIEMAKMAQGKVELFDLQKLVTSIPVDQEKEIEQMKAWRDAWYPGAPSAENMQMPGMSSSMNMNMNQMQSTTPGPAYDAMFIDMMTPHHEGALAMSREALGKAQHSEIKTLAEQIIDSQTKEIEQMRRMKETLGKTAPAPK